MNSELTQALLKIDRKIKATVSAVNRHLQNPGRVSDTELLAFVLLRLGLISRSIEERIEKEEAVLEDMYQKEVQDGKR